MADMRGGQAAVEESWRRYFPSDEPPADMAYETDLAGFITWASPTSERLTGCTPEQLIGTRALDLFHPSERERIAALREAFYEGREHYQQLPFLLHSTHHGYRAVTVTVRPKTGADGAIVGAIVQVTATPDRDAALRALATLSQANRTLIRATDEQTLLQQMCQTIVASGHYLFCWYGRPCDDADQTVRPIASTSEYADYLADIRVSWGDNEFGQGPSGRCLRTGLTQVVNDFDPDDSYRPWREAAHRRGFTCSISLPVFVNGQIDGALMVYAGEVGAFDTLAQDLLEDLAADLGYGIGRLRDAADRQAALQREAESQRSYRLLAENAMDVILLSRPDMVLTWISPSMQSTFGHDPQDLIGTNAAVIIHPDDLPHIVAEVQRTDLDGSILRARHRLLCGDGSYRWIDVAAGHIDDDGTGQPGRVVSLRDVDAEVKAQQELIAREEQYRLLAENASDIVWLATPGGGINWVSPSITTALGWEPVDVIGQVATYLLHPDDQPDVNEIRNDLRGQRSLQGTYRVRRKDGQYRWMSMSIRRVNNAGQPMHVVTMRDVHDEVIARQDLEFALGHDQATGLPNRQVMLDRLSAAQEQLDRFHVVGVLCIGVDSLAEVNEALNHSSGDALLTTIAARIATAIKRPDDVGRGSGNELMVLLPNLRTGADAATVAELIRAAVRGQVKLAHQPIDPTVSIGIATGGPDVDPDQLLRDASLARRKAKELGSDRFEFADPGLAREAKYRLALDIDIREGLRNNEFVPWFQPVVDLADGRVIGYEALARWMRPSGMAQPVHFMSVAQRSSLIVDIDMSVLEQAIRAMASLPAEHSVAVNVSAATLARGQYAERVIHFLTTNGIDPQRLHLEITETMLLDPTPVVVDTIQRLADAGVRWYIDDFGTGYASITSLRDLRMTGIKLDRSFTFGITSRDRTSVQLAQALIGLAHGLELDTVAEGVETQAQAIYLRDLGWQHAQGWLYGKAAPLP